MSTVEAAALQGYGAGLLERSIGFALGTLRSLTPGDLERPTPCRGWNLRMLLRHVDDSLAALYEAIDTGSVRLRPEAGPEPGPEPGADGDPELVAAFRARASRLLGVWSAAEGDGRVVTVGGSPIRAGVVAGTGAIEIAVHAWDASRALGGDRPVPPALAGQLLRLAPMLVTGDTRHGLFDPAVEVPRSSSPSDRLVAFLGRDPARGPSG
ncbi:TIGR03086 family metal-binding protein [Actinomadura yumaensis]|uniref:TIGR03086 family metal-binding protein n=1 Tax=Actinomadura yumaensis TaxID=111807 RepID=A0ABW2CNJ8_9ACTN